MYVQTKYGVGTILKNLGDGMRIVTYPWRHLPYLATKADGETIPALPYGLKVTPKDVILKRNITSHNTALQLLENIQKLLKS